MHISSLPRGAAAGERGLSPYGSSYGRQARRAHGPPSRAAWRDLDRRKAWRLVLSRDRHAGRAGPEGSARSGWLREARSQGRRSAEDAARIEGLRGARTSRWRGAQVAARQRGLRAARSQGWPARRRTHPSRQRAAERRPRLAREAFHLTFGRVQWGVAKW